MNDEDLCDALSRVSTATLTMVLIKHGIRQSWLKGPVPLSPITRRVAGPAFTVRFVAGRDDLCSPQSYARSPAFKDAIEAAPRGSVVVIDGQGNADGATLGDILVARLAARGKTVSADSRRQALVPEGAEVLPNPNGTASGGWLTNAFVPLPWRSGTTTTPGAFPSAQASLSMCGAATCGRSAPGLSFCVTRQAIRLQAATICGRLGCRARPRAR